MTLKQQISDLIKQYRKDYNISQTALAEEIGVSQCTIGNWEDGVVKPHLSSVKKIEEYFDVSLRPTYAMYKGDELLAMGTIDEIAEKLGASVKAVKFIGSPCYEGRTNAGKARRLVKIVEVAE